MITVNGIAISSQGLDQGVVIQFTSQSTPQESGQIITLNTTKKIKSNPATGAFAITLSAGIYQVTFLATTTTTQTVVFINVPTGTASYNFGDLIISGIPSHPVSPVTTVYFQFANGLVNFLDTLAPAAAPYFPLSVNLGVTVWGAGVAGASSLDNPFSPPGGANYIFASGEWMFYDAGQFALTPTTPYRALTMVAGVLGWSAPIASSGLVAQSPYVAGANYSWRDGKPLLWDTAQALIDISRPWRSFGVQNGATIVSAPISLF
jgi:hypothetical protein